MLSIKRDKWNWPSALCQIAFRSKWRIVVSFPKFLYSNRNLIWTKVMRETLKSWKLFINTVDSLLSIWEVKLVNGFWNLLNSIGFETAWENTHWFKRFSSFNFYVCCHICSSASSSRRFYNFRGFRRNLFLLRIVLWFCLRITSGLN